MENKRNARTSWVAVVIVVSLLCVGAYFIARSIVISRSSTLRTATPTPARAGQHVEALGNGMLYYDGTTLSAIDDRARRLWYSAVGMNAGFSVGSGGVAAWSGSMLSLLTGDDGRTLFSGDVGGTVLDARIGTVYAAAQIGEEHNSAILIQEIGGRQVVERIELKNLTVLDFGFFYNDTLLWVMTLNTEGTVPLCMISMYRPGKALTGEIKDSQQVLYDVVFQSSKIRTVGTTHIKDFDYTNKELTDNRLLVYGWYLMGMDERSTNPLMAFVPVDQADGAVGVNDLRMIHGQTDQWVRLPFAAMRVLVQDDAVYAFTNQYVMITHMGETSPNIYALPLFVDGVLALTDNKTAVVTSGGDVYLVPLP